jgi:large subunit ribosomal protein L4
MELEVYNINGSKTSKKVSLSDEIFGIAPNDHAIWLDVKQHQANLRQGTHKTKERNEVVGSTRKIKRQKGTGTARAGSAKSPIFKGGGRTFGPKPRDYGFKLNKKVKILARKSALAYKAIDKSITVVEDFNFEEPKTREFTGMLKNFDLADKKTLVVLSEPDRNIILSARNLSNASVAQARMLNTYEILNASNLILSESSVAVIEEILGNK